MARLALVAALLGVALTTPASAAVFTQAPPARSTSGPYTFIAQSSGGGGSYGGLAYKLPGEQYWHRCLLGPQTVTIPTLAPGTYEIDLSDDINMNWWASQGQIHSGATAGCTTSPPPDPSLLNFARYTFIVDPPPVPSVLAPTPSTVASTTTAPAAAPVIGSAPSAPPAVASSVPVKVHCAAERALLASLGRANTAKRRAYQRHRTSSRQRAWQKASRALLKQRTLLAKNCP